MRRPRVRFTIGRMMLMAAIVAIFLGGDRMIARSREFKRRAALHATEENQRRHVLKVLADDVEYYLQEASACRKQAWSDADGTLDPYWVGLAAEHRESAKQCRQQLAALREQLDHHCKLKEKYEWAVSHPWEWVSPDPREPEYPRFGGPMSRSIGCPILY